MTLALNSPHKYQRMLVFAKQRQPRSSCVPPPISHPQRQESHEESPSYSSYQNVYFHSFLRTVSPRGCLVTLDSILLRLLTIVVDTLLSRTPFLSTYLSPLLSGTTLFWAFHSFHLSTFLSGLLIWALFWVKLLIWALFWANPLVWALFWALKRVDLLSRALFWVVLLFWALFWVLKKALKVQQNLPRIFQFIFFYLTPLNLSLAQL